MADMKDFTILLKVILIHFVFSGSFSFAGTNKFVLPQGNLIMLAPPVANKDYYLLELGFITEKNIKKWDYKYNAYVAAALFEDWLDKEDELRAGGLGFKGGVMLPTQPWVPVLFTVTVGFAKTVLHKNPIFGRDDQIAEKKTMFLLEAGPLYHYKNFFHLYLF